MRVQFGMAAVLALAMGVNGCKKEEPTPTPPAKTDNKPASSPGADALDKAKSQAEKITAGASGTAQNAANVASDTATKLTSIKQLIDEKKLEDADKLLKAVEAEKDKLPEAVQQQIAAARKGLDNARTAAKAVDSGPKPPEVNVAVPGQK